MNDENKKTLDKDISLGGVSFTQKLIFARYLSIMLKSGLTITEALEIIYDQASGKFKTIVNKISKSVQSGNSLSESIKQFPNIFSNLMINSTYAGEVSGTLEENLKSIAEQLEEQQELRRNTTSVMVYPIIILVATFFLGMAMAFLVLPKITPLFEGMNMDLPVTTRALIAMSNLVEAHGVSLFLSIIFSFSFLIWLARRDFSRPVIHYLTLHIPLVKKITKNYNMASFCLTFGTMLKSGISIDKALQIAAKTVSNYYYRKNLITVAERTAHGSKLSDNLQEFDAYFPKLMISMVKVGERSGNLEETMFYLSDFYKKEVDFATKSLSTAIEPIMLIGIGIVVATMAMSIITPIYQITGNVS